MAAFSDVCLFHMATFYEGHKAPMSLFIFVLILMASDLPQKIVNYFFIVCLNNETSKKPYI